MTIDFEDLRQWLFAAVVCDVLDSLGCRLQSPSIPLVPLTVRSGPLVGRCKTTLWADLYHDDPRPYELELAAVDACQPNDVMIAAAGGSVRSGVWGELLTTAARNRGCVGAVVDGAVRDVKKMSQMEFPVYARTTCIYDSLHRQRVVDVDVSVEIAGVVFNPGDIVVADVDGVVVIPSHVEQQVLELAKQKVDAEDQVRTAIQQGMLAAEAYAKYGVL